MSVESLKIHTIYRRTRIKNLSYFRATLTLFYMGSADNDPEPMYVALNGNAVVNNDDPDAALAEEWTQLDIPPQTFADQGVNLANVGSLSIALGNKAAPVAGGTGMVFIDDIRLYRPWP